MAGWLGVTVEQAAKGAPVGKEMTGTAVETSNNTTATRALMFMFECGEIIKGLASYIIRSSVCYA